MQPSTPPFYTRNPTFSALRTLAGWCLASVAFAGCLVWSRYALGAETGGDAGADWWVWPIGLFLLTSVLGVLAVMAGIGGSVLFVPIVSGFLPFLHIDFVRGAGLMVALTGALSAGPRLIRENLADLRLAIPNSLVASFAAIFGALLGLALPAAVVQVALGVVILTMSAIMAVAGGRGRLGEGPPDWIAARLGIEGRYRDAALGEWVTWRPRRMATGLVLFSGIGLMAGLFGLGAGWANVPVLHLVMGVPLRVAVATSYFLLAITDTAAAWVYFNRGAVLPLIVIPSVLGIMLGAQIGARILVRINPTIIRRVVIGVLFLAGARALLRGLGI